MQDLLINNWKQEKVHFVFEDKEEFSNYYAFESLTLLQRINANIQTAKACQQEQLGASTKKRIEHYQKGQEKLFESLRKLLKPLGYEQIPHQDYLSYIQHNKGPSALSPNFENVFRDWCWGEMEALKSVSILQSLADTVNDKKMWERVIYLGAGGGRIPYELHVANNSGESIVMDINPLLIEIARRVIQGEELKLVEFPATPKIDNDYWFERILKAKKPLSKEMNFFVSDARIPLLAAESVSCVVTPWLIDVVDMDLEDFFSVINHYLPIGGIWLNTGPLQFEYRGMKHHYSKKEVAEFVKNAGFEIVEEKIAEVSYMKGPDVGSYRHEQTYSFIAKKVKKVELIEFNLLLNQPDWYLDHEESINLPVENLKLVSAHQLNAKVLALVDGNKNLNQVTDELQKEFSDFERGQLKYLIAQIIKNSVYAGTRQVY